MIRRIVLSVVGIFIAAALQASPGGEPPASPGGQTPSGVVVVAVDPGSPAERAGILRGDVLLKADKISLQTAADLRFYVDRVGTGQLITLELTRGGDPMVINVEIGSRNDRPYLGLTAQGGRSGSPTDEVEVPRIAPGLVPGSGPLPLRGTMGNWAVQAQISEVADGSPAAQAGVRTGDSIVAVDGQRLTIGQSLNDVLGKHAVGDTVELEVLRDGQSQKLSVRLGSSPQDSSRPYLGVTYRTVFLPWTGLDADGYVVLRVADDGPAAAAGVAVGDVIAAIAGSAVDSTKTLAEVIAGYKPGDVLELGLKGAGGERTVRVTLGQRPDDATKAYLGVSAGVFSRSGLERLVPDDIRPRMRSLPLGGARATAI